MLPSLPFRRGLFQPGALCLAMAAAAPAAGQAAPQRTADVVPRATQPVQRAAGTMPYTINPGDELEVYVWGEERLQRQIRVLPDGTIAMPLVGQVVAQGLLPEQLQEVITRRLVPQFRDQVPQVTVSVKAPAGLVFSIVGRVRSPGTFTPGRYVNILEALSMAGGPGEFAGLDNISIVRKTPTGLVTIRTRLGGVLKNGVPDTAAGRDAIPRIESGDTIIVP